MAESAEHGEELFEILNKYLSDLEKGTAPTEEEFLSAHPEIRERLETCLRSLDFFKESGSEQGSNLIGKTLGDYEIEREIGRGGMGVVYEARQVSLGRSVALKTLPTAATLNERQLRRFKNEAVAAAQLQHANIVPVHAVGAHEGVYYYAMRLIPGITMAEGIEALRSGTQLPQLETLLGGSPSIHSRAYCRACARVAIQVARALSHAHQKHIVHRDIKPANLIIDDDGQVWITDFGLAALLQQQGATLTMSGDLVGTARYMSPEQWRPGTRPVDHRTDVYSLGVTLSEFLTLERPFPGEGLHELMESVLREDSIDVGQINRACPRALVLIIKKATANDPDERYATAAELGADLQRFLDDQPIHARAPTLGERARAWTRRHRGWVAVAAVAVVATIVGASLLATRDQDAAREKQRADQTPVHSQQVNRLIWEARGLVSQLQEEAALDAYLRSVPPLKLLVEWHPDNPTLRWQMSHVRLQIVRALHNLGLHKDALPHVGAAINHRAWMQENHPGATERGDMRVHRAMAIGMQASCLWSLGRREQARDGFRECLSLLELQAAQNEQPDVIWAYLPFYHYRLGLLLREMGRPEESAAAFQAALRTRKAGHVYEMQWQGWIRAQCPDPTIRSAEQAVRLSKQALDGGPPGDATRLLIYGAACYRAGRLEDAIKAIHDARNAWGGSNGLHWYLLAMAHWKRGERDEAQAWFEKSDSGRDTTCLLPDFSLAELAILKAEASTLLGR